MNAKRRAKGEWELKDPASEAQVPATVYEPTAHDRKVMQAYFDEQRANPPPPRLRVLKQGSTLTLASDHPDNSVGLVLLTEALGLTDFTLARDLLSQMTKAANGNEGSLNAMIAFVRGLEPRDSLEATLATQMAAVHALTMTFAQRLNNVEKIQQQTVPSEPSPNLPGHSPYK